jgi:hypothetical protein
MKNQILSLAIDIDTNKQSITKDGNANVFTHIFSTFNNLQCLCFGLSSYYNKWLSFNTVPIHVVSTNLLKLHVCLNNLSDCLYLLDGCFNQLHTFRAKIFSISHSHLTNSNEVCYSKQVYSLFK